MPECPCGRSHCSLPRALAPHAVPPIVISAIRNVGCPVPTGTDCPSFPHMPVRISMSEATMSNIRQNLFFAFIYNAAGVPIAAGVLYPVFGLLLSPIIAAAAMALSSVSVIANALRLRNVDVD